jgi:hypothetical protein
VDGEGVGKAVFFGVLVIQGMILLSVNGVKPVIYARLAAVTFLFTM